MDNLKEAGDGSQYIHLKLTAEKRTNTRIDNLLEDGFLETSEEVVKARALLKTYQESDIHFWKGDRASKANTAERSLIARTTEFNKLMAEDRPEEFKLLNSKQRRELMRFIGESTKKRPKLARLLSWSINSKKKLVMKLEKGAEKIV